MISQRNHLREKTFGLSSKNDRVVLLKEIIAVYFANVKHTV